MNPFKGVSRKVIPITQIVFVGLLIISCVNANQYIDKKYEGYWAETSWTYEFKNDGQFIYKSNGHFGFVTESGFYLIQDSLILLNPKTDWLIYDGVLKPRLKIINNNCIRDFDNNFYCDQVDTINKLIEHELAFQNKIIDIIDTLQIVRNEKLRVASYYPNKEDLNFKIIYDGIIIIDNQEFHEFNLNGFNIKDGELSYLSFLATKQPFKIFGHSNVGHKLSLIYKE